MIRATLNERFKAFLIDNIFWYCLATILLLIFKHFEIDYDTTIIFLSPLSCWILFKDLNGRGIGKWYMRLRIIKNAEPYKSPNMFVLILRNFTLIFGIDFYLLLFGKEGKRLGEKWTNTIVVREKYQK